MKKLILFAVVALVVAAGANAYAELKDVTVGGSVRVRGEAVDPLWFDSNLPGDDFVSTTTRLNITAEMTEGVSAFVELQEIDIWGSDMKVGFPGPSGLMGPTGSLPVPGSSPMLDDEDGFSLYRGYILIEDVADYEGLALKIGRQEIVAGTEWFFGNNDFGPGLSYDAISATYAQDDLTLLAFVAKLAEGRTQWGTEDDADVDLYGIYSTYTGMEDMVVDAYFALLRAADRRWDEMIPGGGQLPMPQCPDDLDDDPLELYTLGGRVGGLYDALDYNLEAAIQWGDNGWDGDYEGWAVDAGVGFTFDHAYNPRLGFNYTFSSGDDDENDDNTETFLAPFADNYHRYGYMDLIGLGNMDVMKLSMTAQPYEKVGVGCHLLHFLAVEHEDNVAPFGGTGWVDAHADTVGTELDLVANYDYSEDLSFELAYAYLWAGSYIDHNPVLGDDDMQRIYLQAKLVF